ncbi:MAG: histidine phosphatase family protein [Cyanobacteria bacterium J06597_16]
MSVAFMHRAFSLLCLLALLTSCANPQESAQVSQPTPSEVAETPELAPTVSSSQSETQNATQSETQNLPKAEMTGDEELWATLAQADSTHYVVLFRHAIAPGTGDPGNFQFNDCTTQRNLSEAGQEQARLIGKAFRARGVSVEKVLSSQWCRCLETAELMDIGPVEPFPALNSFFRDRSTAAAQTDQLRDYIAANQNNPGVTVMVTHQVNITALTDIFPQSGSAVVLQLDDSSGNSDERQLNILGQLAGDSFSP